jgi:hypothetical protein
MTSSSNPIEIPHAVCSAYFSANPAHNSLQFKKLRRHANLWSVRVTLDVRAVGYREGDIIEWLWIGTHNEFDKLFG